MEPRKEAMKEPKGDAPSASKGAASKKQQGGGEHAASPSTTNTQPNNASSNAQGGGEKDLLQQAKQTTGEVLNQVQQRAGSEFTQQKESAASDLSKVVDAVRQIGQTLEKGEQTGPIARAVAQYGDKAANKLERLTKYIREQEPQQLLDDVQNFGRRQPVLLLGGAFLLGFAGARLIKSSLEAGAHHTSYGSNVRRNTNVGASRNRQTPNVSTPPTA